MNTNKQLIDTLMLRWKGQENALLQYVDSKFPLLKQKKNVQLTFGYFKKSYEVYNQIGCGNYGVVRHCVRKQDKHHFSAKFVNKDKLDVDELTGILEELFVLRSLPKHPNIMCLYDVFESKSTIIFILSLLRGGEMLDRIYFHRNKPDFGEKQAAHIFKQVLSALQFMHERGMVHRDIKAEHVMFERQSKEYGTVCIIDFGLAVQLREATNSNICRKPQVMNTNSASGTESSTPITASPNTTLTPASEVSTAGGTEIVAFGGTNSCKERSWLSINEFAGTPEYMAPEIYCNYKFNQCIDMWSSGCVLYALLCGIIPFRFDSKRNFQNLEQSIVHPDWNKLIDENNFWKQNISESAKDLIKGLLNPKMKDRLTAKAALQHPWFAQAEISNQKCPNLIMINSISS
ncbi:hypothetical protein RFI_17755 [Reticulomyxa filosa]|uniref:Protein kinase domain-containing protein n=1 Tax=Reticulomyxa filosa TaxID=46433 RepID=X6MZM5_RETFI|nr:hypothetical protein RFI_17755 [Reticulomyxa filosa]|eukprot:ETO19475.1 hypothetical protein RFI_17755 [Reticulomyxa filosa]